MIRSIEFKPWHKEHIVTCCDVLLEDGLLIKNLKLIVLNDGIIISNPKVKQELVQEILKKHREYIVKNITIKREVIINDNE